LEKYSPKRTKDREGKAAVTDHYHAVLEDSARVAMTKVPTVSAVIPTYNRGHLLKNAIDSILAQTYPVHEIIVVDDGSTDGTREMLESYVKEESGSIRCPVHYFYQQNQGQSVALNKGIEMGNGEWIAFLHSDDAWLPQKLESQFRAIEHFDWQCGLCFTDAQFVNNPHMQTATFQLAGMCYQQPLGIVSDPLRSIVGSEQPYPGVWVSTQLVRADLARRIAGFDPQLRCSEDQDFLFRLALITNLCFVNSPQVSIDRTPVWDRASKLWDRVDIRLRNDQYRCEKWLNLSAELPPDVRIGIRNNLRDIHSAWTNFYLEREEYESARQEISTALKYGLTYMLAIKWILTQIAPKLARKVVLKYARRCNPDRF